jgi:hypothetical protein
MARRDSFGMLLGYQSLNTLPQKPERAGLDQNDYGGPDLRGEVPGFLCGITSGRISVRKITKCVGTPGFGFADVASLGGSSRRPTMIQCIGGREGL